MDSDKLGKPSGVNDSEGTGTPSNMEDKDLQQDKQITDKYTDNDESLAEQVRTNNPNRNVEKTDATNAGGYKN